MDYNIAWSVQSRGLVSINAPHAMPAAVTLSFRGCIEEQIAASISAETKKFTASENISMHEILDDGKIRGPIGVRNAEWR